MFVADPGGVIRRDGKVEKRAIGAARLPNMMHAGLADAEAFIPPPAKRGAGERFKPGAQGRRLRCPEGKHRLFYRAGPPAPPASLTG